MEYYLELKEVDKITILAYKYIEKTYPYSIIIPEVSINGRVADLLSVNGDIHIFEIKSKNDTLYRLTEQLRAFKLSANKVTIIADEKFQQKILNRNDIQDVGIVLISKKNKLIELKKPTHLSIKKSNFYLNYWSPIELRETLRGFKSWYKLSTIDAMNKLINILDLDEIRRLTLFRLKEKFYTEYLERIKHIKNNNFEQALKSRYQNMNILKITPLKKIAFSIFRDFD